MTRSIMCDGLVTKHGSADALFRTPQNALLKHKLIHTFDLQLLEKQPGVYIVRRLTCLLSSKMQ